MNAVNPQLMTIATLTGHACLAVGEPYSIIMDNGPAARLDVAKQVQHSGHVMGDFFEISTIRKEDYAFHKGLLPVFFSSCLLVFLDYRNKFYRNIF